MTDTPDRQQFRHSPGLAAQATLIRFAPIVSILAMFLAVFLGFGLTTERFLSSVNLLNVLRQVAPSLVVGVAATLVIVSAGIDLSVGSMVAFAGVAAAILLQDGVAPEATLPIVLGFGCLAGLVAGYFIAYQGLPAFIVTLAELSILAGLAKLVTQGFSISIDTDVWFLSIGQGQISEFPSPSIIAAVVVLFGWILLVRTRFGLHLRAIGSNQEAVRRAGVPVKRTIALVYGLSGLSAALAGVMNSARLQSGNTSSGLGLELQIIAAVVLGGTSLFGGRGSILGTVLGVFTIALINNGLILNHVSPFFVSISQGAILLLAVWLNTKVFSRWL